MWICEAPSSTARRSSAAYSSGVEGIAGHWSRFAIAPLIEQLMITGASKRLISSPPLPVGLPLPEEGLEHLLDVLSREGQRELAAQELEAVVERHVLLAVHGVVAELHQHRALRRQPSRPVGDRGVELGRRDDPVGQAVLGPLLVQG